MSIVNKNIFFCDAILADFNNLQSESFLYEAEFIILSEDKRLAVFYINGVLGTSFFCVYTVMSAIVENDTVLEYFSYAGTFMVVSCFQNLYGSRGICSNCTGKEVSASTKTKFCRAERIFHRSVRT